MNNIDVIFSQENLDTMEFSFILYDKTNNSLRFVIFHEWSKLIINHELKLTESDINIIKNILDSPRFSSHTLSDERVVLVRDFITKIDIQLLTYHFLVSFRDISLLAEKIENV